MIGYFVTSEGRTCVSTMVLRRAGKSVMETKLNCSDSSKMCHISRHAATAATGEDRLRDLCAWYRSRFREASWRSGYAADCKSRGIASATKDLSENGYQDRAGTPGEHDNGVSRRGQVYDALDFAVTRGDPALWGSVPDVLVRGLTDSERKLIAAAFLASLDQDDAESVVLKVMGEAGVPWPPLVDLVGTATIWAAAASQREREVYALVAFLSLPHDRRNAFVSRAAKEVTR